MGGESELSLSYDDLQKEVGAFLGYGADALSWNAEQTSEVDRYIQAGYRRFLFPPAMEGVEAGYAWSFLSPVTTLDTAVNTGTQDLPDDHGRILGPLNFPQSEHYPPVVKVSEDRLQALLSRTESAGPPQVARIRHKAKSCVTGQRLEISFWPIPDAVYTLAYRYEAYTGKISTDANRYPLGGMRHAELLVASCLAVAEKRANDELGLHTEEFRKMLIAAIQQDRRVGAQHYGHMGAFTDIPVVPRHGETGVSYNVTYKGQTH